MPIAQLDRDIIRLSGEGVTTWLDGLITNSLKHDINFAALLTPQGKIIADFFTTTDNETLLLDVPVKFTAVLMKRLMMYKLRAPITIEKTDLNLYALWDGCAGEGDSTEGWRDPRHPALGQRLITTAYMEASDDYDAHRLSLGVVDSAVDFETGRIFPADANMDLMNGVDYQKGCFIGQEVVSRMKRMTTAKKRMRGVVLSGPAKAGDKIMAAERVIGDIVHVHGSMAMAMIRLDRMGAAQTHPALNGHKVDIMRGVDGER